MTRFKALALSFLLFLSSVLITALAAEAWLTIAKINTKSIVRYVPGEGVTYLPGAYYRHTKEGFSEGYINSHGFRDYERTYEKPANTFRILVLGDSYVEALQVALENSFPSLLEKKLNENSTSVKFEVLNLGQSGFGTADEYTRYLNFGVKYNPDLVVVAFLTGNDFRDNSKVFSGGELRFYFVFDKRGNLVLDESFFSDYDKTLTRGKRLFQAVKRHSYLLSLISERIYLLRIDSRWKHYVHKVRWESAQSESLAKTSEFPDFSIYLPGMSDHWKEAFAVTKAALVKFRDSVEANRSRFVLVTLSNAAQVHPELQKEIEERYGGVRFDFEQPDRIIEEFARREHITYLKLMPLFREYHLRTGKYLHGFGVSNGGHWNEHGHRLAAEKIFEFLKEKNLVPTDAPRSGLSNMKVPQYRLKSTWNN